MSLAPFSKGTFLSEASLAELAASSEETLALRRFFEASKGRFPSELGTPSSLCSSRDPLGEAERQTALFFDDLGGRRPRAVLCLGFASGRHVELLAERLGPSVPIFVAEPFPALFPVVSEDFPFSKLAARGFALRICVSADPSRIAEELSAFLDSRDIAFPEIMTHPGARRLWPARFAALERELLRLARRRMADLRTSGSLSAEWLFNAVANLPLAFERPGLDAWRDFAKGGTFFVLGAGPSLDAACEWLPSVIGRHPVICVGTALRSLLAKGLRPDFAMIVDSDPKVERQFDGIPSDAPFTLLAPLHAPPPILRRFRSRLAFFSTSLLPGMNAALSASGHSPPRLLTAGTVALSAVDFARFCGAKRIALAGLDLAFRPDGRTHASASVYDGVKADASGLVQVAGLDGGTVPTSPQFAHYVALFDSYFKELAGEGVELFNASRGGALLKGATRLEPGSEGLFAEEGAFFAKPSESRACQSAPFAVKDSFLALPSALERVAAKAGAALAASGRLLDKDADSGAVLASLDVLDKEINSDTLAVGLCGDALKALSLNVPARLSAKGASCGDKELVALCETLYGSLAGTARRLAGDLSSALSVQGGL